MTPRSLWEAAMALLNFRKRDHAGFEPVNRDVVSLLQG